MKARFIFLALLLVFGALFWAKNFPFNGFNGAPRFEDLKLPEALKDVEKIKKEISAPAPLRLEKQAEVSSLTPKGIILWTNQQRKIGGLPELRENFELDSAARAKVADMFKNQYFAHVSPEGKDAAFVVEGAGYEFISVGENLALGNFENDRVLVEAWMNSPGHRANILGENFLEIGVAVGRGEFATEGESRQGREGKDTWLAVQEFARPLSACPQPNPSLKSGIEASEKRLEELVVAANTLKSDLESQKPKGREEVEGYNRKIGEYNLLAKEINALSANIKTLIATYNLQVKALNLCISG